MPERGSPDPNESSFRELLRRGVQELREQRGRCPDSEDLVAFHEGRLPAERAAQVRDHVEACGLCDVALGRLESAKTGAPSRSLWERVRAFWINPIVAYAIVAILLYPAYRGIAPRREWSPHSGAVQGLTASAPRFTLDTVRSNSGAKVVRVPQNQQVFILSLLVPVRPGFHYSARISDSTGTLIFRLPELVFSDEFGNCSLVCSRRQFPAGPYTLVVTERTQDGNSTDRQFMFQFLIQE